MAEKKRIKQFLGRCEHNIDEKGRLFIPAKFRAFLGEDFVICKSFHDTNCLFAFTEDDFDKLYDSFGLDSDIYVDADTARVQRMIYSSASYMKIDKQGRTLVPKNLREDVGMTKEVVLIGSGRRIEIWPLEDWNKEMGDNIQNNISRRRYDEMRSKRNEKK